MIHLFLNDTEVFPGQDTEIQITKENPVMTGSGSYTLDVELPLSIAANRKFFGALDRPETHKERISYDMALYADNKPLLIGTAVLTKTTEEIVNVQLLAGNSNELFWTDAENYYIDEQDYNTDIDGSITGTVGADIFLSYVNSFDMNYVENSSEVNINIGAPYWLGHLPYSRAGELTFLGRKGYFCCMQFHDVDKDTKNELGHYGNIFYGYNTAFLYKEDSVVVSNSKDDHLWLKINNGHLNLLYVIKRLFYIMGYSIDMSYYNDSPVSDIYIGSAIPTNNLNVTLPHWTVKEFIEQVQSFLNITFSFDDVSKIVTFEDNRNIISNAEELKDAEDVQEVTIEDEQSANTVMFSTLAYDDDGDKYYNIKSDIRDKYPLVNVEPITVETLNAAYNAQDEKVRNWRFYGNNGNIWVKDDDGNWRQVDMFRPLDRGTEDTLTLKIVPAALSLETNPYIYCETEEATGAAYVDKDDGLDGDFAWHLFVVYPKNLIKRRGTYRMLSLENGYGGYKTISGSVWDKIEEQETQENGDKEDYMPVYLHHPDVRTETNHYDLHVWNYVYENVYAFSDWKDHYSGTSIAQPELRYFDWENCPVNSQTYQGITEGDTSGDSHSLGIKGKSFGGIPYTDRINDFQAVEDGQSEFIYSLNNSLALCDRTESGDVWGIYKFHENVPPTNKQTVLQKNFISHEIPDVRHTFLIHGKPFACQKIEYTVKNEGIDPLMTGYFVEITSQE